MQTTATHPSGLTVTFAEEDHTYIVNQTGESLESATTFIGNFFPKFNADEVAPKCAGKGKYKGMTVEEVKQAWAEEAERGSREGTNTHWFAECLSNGNLDALPDPQSEREANLFKQAAAAILSLEERFIFIAAEKIIFSPTLGLAGTIDLLMIDPKNNDILILDYKQNKKLSVSNPWQTGLSPINHLEASDFVKYGLQLSLYQKILTEEHYFDSVGYRRGLIHLKEQTFKAYPLKNYMLKDINMMLEAKNGVDKKT